MDKLSALPVGVSGWASLGGEVRTSAVETSSLAASGSQTVHFSVLVGGVNDPVDSGVVSDGWVGRIDHDDFEPLVHGVLADPV